MAIYVKPDPNANNRFVKSLDFSQINCKAQQVSILPLINENIELL